MRLHEDSERSVRREPGTFEDDADFSVPVGQGPSLLQLQRAQLQQQQLVETPRRPRPQSAFAAPPTRRQPSHGHCTMDPNLVSSCRERSVQEEADSAQCLSSSLTGEELRASCLELASDSQGPTLKQEDLVRLRCSMRDLGRTLQSRITTKPEDLAEMVRSAIEVVSHDIAQHDQEVRQRLDHLIGREMHRWEVDEQRWAQLNMDLAGIGERIRKVEEESYLREKDMLREKFHLQDELEISKMSGREAADRACVAAEAMLEELRGSGMLGATSVAEANQAATQKLTERIEESFHDVQKILRSLPKDETIRKVLEPFASSIEDKVSEVARVADDALEQARLLEELEQREAALQNERQKKEQLQQRLADQNRELEEKTQSHNAEELRATRLLASVQELREKLESNDGKWNNTLHFLAQIKSLEDRGNISVNLTNGHVLVKKALEFKPRKSTEEPLAEFTNEKTAMPTVKDVAELVKLMPVPLTIQAHARQSNDSKKFEGALAQNRANLIKQHIEENGADPGLLASKVLPGKAGSPAVTIKLELFS